MAYQVKKRKEVEPTPTPDQIIGREFVAIADQSNELLTNLESGPTLPTAGEIVSTLHSIGVGLHDKLEELLEDESHREPLIRGAMAIFSGCADTQLVHSTTPLGVTCITRKDTNLGTTREVSPEEAARIIRRSAICYGLVSGLARAAGEAIHAEDHDEDD